MTSSFFAREGAKDAKKGEQEEAGFPLSRE
jgi:hypothetical protein